MHITTYLRVPAWFLNRRGCRHTWYLQARAGRQSWSFSRLYQTLSGLRTVLLRVDQWRRSLLDYHAQPSSAGWVSWACQRLSPADWPLIHVPSRLACVSLGCLATAVDQAAQSHDFRLPVHHKVNLLITKVQKLPCISIPVTLQLGRPLNLQAAPESVVVTYNFYVLLCIRCILVLITDIVIM